MKYATFSKSAFAVSSILLGLVAAACANSADPPGGDTLATEPIVEEAGAKIPPSTPTTTPPPADKVCAPSCKTDNDCTTTCPALAGGVQCCDLKTNTCWGSKTSSCPVAVDPGDAGMTPAY